ncbi:MAG: multicopper oxidase domain-containing protein [Chloroflexi bacterium]|nr:multicopper oxidase domain-containing protein [Chloroflexota bacterium]
MNITRRDFLKYAGGGVAVLVVGSKLSWLTRSPVFAATQTINFTIGDVMKEMGTHNSTNDARCYFWVYKSNTPDYLPECPGPNLIAAKGDTIDISVTNSLDEDHAFYIPGIVDSGPIEPGETWNGVIDLTAAPCGAYMYYDNLNQPVNRVMGLHGTFVVMPTEADRTAGHKLTPYGGLAAEHGVQRLYDDFGSSHFPGLAWEEGDSSTWALYDPVHDGPTPVVNCPPFRQYIWMTSQASPNLFAEVGNYTAGQDYPAQQFLDKFLRDSFHLHQHSSPDAMIPQYFLINGQSGMFSHFNPTVTPMGRVGEPVIVHILNAGLWTHSMHLHANHLWITSVNGVVNPNPIWVDVFRIDPMTRIDYTIPFMRPPDVGHPKGIGLPETPLQTDNGHPVWPPIEEFNYYMPAKGTKAKRLDGTDCELGQRMSPLCYPMHDHSEPSQTSQGGNYNTGLISGIYFTGDRNGMMDFPMDEDFHMVFQNFRGCSLGTERAAPPLGEHYQH